MTSNKDDFEWEDYEHAKKRIEKAKKKKRNASASGRRANDNK